MEGRRGMAICISLIKNKQVYRNWVGQSELEIGLIVYRVAGADTDCFGVNLGQMRVRYYNHILRVAIKQLRCSHCFSSSLDLSDTTYPWHDCAMPCLRVWSQFASHAVVYKLTQLGGTIVCNLFFQRYRSDLCIQIDKSLRTVRRRIVN